MIENNPEPPLAGFSNLFRKNHPENFSTSKTAEKFLGTTILYIEETPNECNNRQNSRSSVCKSAKHLKLSHPFSSRPDPRLMILLRLLQISNLNPQRSQPFLTDLVLVIDHRLDPLKARLDIVLQPSQLF